MSRKFYSRALAVLSAVAVTFAFSSCNDDKSDDAPAPDPSVEVTAGTATENSVAFTVTPQHATKCAYTVVEKGQAVPSADEVLSKGTSLAADKASSKTEPDLKAGTTYTVVAAVSNGSKSVSATKDIATLATPAATPTVTLEKGEAKSSSLTFKVTPTNATRCAYLCVEATESAPTAMQIFAKGKETAADKVTEPTASGLQPETNYVIYAVASNGDDNISEVARVEMATIKFEADVTFAATWSRGFYYGDYQENGNGNFLLQFGNTPLNDKGQVTGAGIVCAFDLYSALATDAAHAELKPGVYNVDMKSTYAEFTVDAENSLFQTFDATPSELPQHTYTGGTVTVSKEGDGYKIVAQVTLDDNRVVEATYTGPVTFTDKSGGDTPEIALTQSVAQYWGDAYQNGTTNFVLIFADEAGENYFNIDMLTAKFSDFASATIPAGTYPINETYKAGSCTIGGVVEQDNKNYAVGTYFMQVTTEGKKFGFLTSGTVTIAKSDDIYTVTIDGMTDNNLNFKGKYTGQIPITNKTSNSTLTGDYKADLSGVAKGDLIFYGDVLENGTGICQIVLNPKAADKDGLLAMFVIADPDVNEIAEGDYTAATSTLSPFNFLPGLLSDDGKSLQFTWYIGYDKDGRLTKYAPAIDGTINVAKSGDGYKVTLDFIDDAGNKVTGDWTGSVTVKDGRTSASGLRSLNEMPAQLGPQIVLPSRQNLKMESQKVSGKLEKISVKQIGLSVR